MEQFFVFLYPLVAVISIIAYVPQIKTLLFATRRPQNLSLSSWVMWCFTSFIAFGYSFLHVHDFMLSLTTGLNMGLVFITTAMIAYNRYVRFGAINEKMDMPASSEAVPVKIKSTYK